MKTYRNTTRIMILISSIFIFITYLINRHMPDKCEYKAIFISCTISIFSGAILSMYTAIIGYVHEKNKNYFNINNFIYCVNLTFSSPLISCEDYVIHNVSKIKQISSEYKSTIKMINDYQTFYIERFFGYKYKQINDIHKIFSCYPQILNYENYMSNCSSTEDYFKSLCKAKEEYLKYENQIKSLIDNYNINDKMRKKVERKLQREKSN